MTAPASRPALRIDVVTLFPELVTAVGRYGVTGRAVEQGLLVLECWNPRDFARDRHRSVDDRPFGGGPGMVLQVQPMRDAIRAARRAAPEPVRACYLTPQGRRLDQAVVRELAGRKRLLLVAGRYEGVDERLIESEIDEELSIGDYVLSGGELAAMVVVDAVARQVPGVLGDEDSPQEESFTGDLTAGLLEYPQYTRPQCIDGREVPAVLLSGDHAAIRRWREKQALGRTWLKRPDLLAGRRLDERQQRLLQEFIEEYRNKRRGGAAT